MFIKKLFRTLNEQKIQYALVGGYAVALHGAVRGTTDVDIVTLLAEENLSRLEQSLNGLGLFSRIPVRAKEMAIFREKFIEEKNLTAWSFANPSNPLEVVDVLVRFDLKEFQTISKNTVFGEITLVSLNDLIAMKKLAGREQDLADVAALEKLTRHKGKIL